METMQTTNKKDNSPEAIWAILREVSESQKETERIFKENAKKASEEMAALKKSLKETEHLVKENSRQMGLNNNRFGEVVEYMIAPNLCKKFSELGLEFEKSNPNTLVSDHKNNIHFEVDVTLENGDTAMLVEVKNKLTTEHVKGHIRRLEKMRKYADLRGDKRSFLGAVAGVVMTSNAKKYALSQGFYVIEPSGEAFKITSPGDKLKKW
jgi:ElaB/YqjD/DUF883 family membrane-anchored ribosome-binding protein